MVSLSVHRPRSASLIAVFVLVAALLGLVARPAAAATTWTTVASGLDNPRHIGFGSNGRLYVAEAGRGGSTCTPGGGPEGPSCFGTSSKVTLVNVASGAKRTVVDGLFSIAGEDGSFALGADGLSFINNGHSHGQGALYVQMSANTHPIPPGDDPLFNAARAQLGRLLHVSQGGQWKAVANVGDFDYDWTDTHHNLDPNNPEWPDANPYGIWATPSKIYVTDAGANTLDIVRPNGDVSVAAWFPNTNLTQLSDAVPTCIVETSAGIFVGDLNGQLWKFDGSFTPVHQDLTGDQLASIEGCTTDGTNIYVADMFAGTVAKITPSGATTIVADGLNFPAGVALSGNTLYVSNNGTFAGIGEIVKTEL